MATRPMLLLIHHPSGRGLQGERSGQEVETFTRSQAWPRLLGQAMGEPHVFLLGLKGLVEQVEECLIGLLGLRRIVFHALGDAQAIEDCLNEDG
jgi:hypothetical protein